ncbi:Predicted protein [Taphrina deformans PYCC 5710]|uniref:KOW domain-containing protein n=1 Tax=Taphrina deformans (strain PYCC 5710 / ATCC 11124 / CBS 356.35 / IMI 108563 / JCM 9778 / NBRC 8474) TaxID=1097556 RepID=R4X7Z7_TAPDE|nr:Predicted protein [Taphrina deformans PYCC 5710]|eukprot:CCG81600.1 Predicted protein [Taphrina deformans PYCC 5710]
MNRTVQKALKAKDKIKLWNIAVGDDVKVISGPYKGKVGKVQECLKDKNKIVVSGVNIIKKVLPLFLSQRSGMEKQRLEYAGPIHYSNVQLVGDIPSSTNPTGPKRTVEIKRVNRGKTFYNKDKKLLTWRRWIPGENVFLPWPRNEQSKVDGPLDTKQAEVSTNTYIESLHSSPVPFGIEHELRNKYSRYRRHEREDESFAVEDIEGVEAEVELTDDISIAKTSPGKIRKTDATTGMNAATLRILADALSKTKVQAQDNVQ